MKKTSRQIREKSLSVHKFIEMSNVDTLCTTDDPTDNLEYHVKLKNEGKFKTKVLPAFRPDKVLQINAEGYQEYIHKLLAVSGVPINRVDGLVKALYQRVGVFAQNGCVDSNHAMAEVPTGNYTQKEADHAFKKRLAGATLSQEEFDGFFIYILKCLAKKYHELNIAMELHIGALRNTNEKMFKKLGPDAGYDSVRDSLVAKNLADVLGNLEAENCLPKTILFSLDTKDYYSLSTMCGNYHSDEIPGKMQFEAA